MGRPRNGKRTEQTDTATELPEVRREVGAGNPSGGGSSSQAVQHLEPESFFEEKSLVEEATESLGRRKLKDPLKDGLRGHQEKRELKRPGPLEP